jgi:chemotaxis protein MotB
MKSRQEQPAGNASESGVRLLIVSLFIILLAFFIVLNAIAVPDERGRLEALGSLIGSFGILPGGLSPMKGEGQSIGPPQPPIVSRETEPGEFVGMKLSGSGPVLTRSTATGEAITIQDQVIFDEANYKIKPSSYGFLKELCEMINQDGYPVEIVGHTDSMPSDEKSADSNWAISALKALEVLKFFVVIGKVEPARLTAYGRSEYKPILSNETRQTRAQNRRVEIVLGGRPRQSLEQIVQKKPSGFVVFKRFVFRIFD